MNPTERLLTQRIIASVIDYPSVYMGGPSRGAMRTADSIIKALEKGKRLVPTTCDHSGWKNYKENGTCCPDCCTLLDKEEAAE